MADDQQTPPAGTGTSGNGSTEDGAQAGIIAQYVKDLSFENPQGARSLQQVGQEQPKIDISINVNAARVGDEAYEVALNITAKAQSGEVNTFLIELVYAGLFAVKNLPDEHLEQFLLIECPRILFPFARRVVADATRDGGFPPLLLEPIDFGLLYQKHLEARQQEAAQPSD